jgi:hypothetical protein
VTTNPPVQSRRQLGDASRRAIITVLILGSIVGIVFTVRAAQTGTENESLPDTVERTIPVAGGEVPRQSLVGIELADRHDAYLVINGVTVRDAADGLIKDLGTGLVQFQPAPGLPVESLESGQNCVVAYVWDQIEDVSTAQPVSWCFTAF